MEIVAPMSVMYFAYPMQGWVVWLFVLHYVNRAIIQPLSSPTRSPLHASVVLSAIGFNLTNGYLIGTWIQRARYSSSQDTLSSRFAPLGLLLFVVGFAGNIWHDRVLSQLRKTTASAKSIRSSHADYRVPYGGLYRWISYPNYFCECTWETHAGIEWYGWAICCFCAVPHNGDVLLSHPPALFVVMEIAVMLPRALRGHHWYRAKFGVTPQGTYPAERKAIVPWVL